MIIIKNSEDFFPCTEKDGFIVVLFEIFFITANQNESVTRGWCDVSK